MKRKTKVIVGLVLLAIGVGGYFYTESQMHDNGYQLARLFGSADSSLETFNKISIVVVWIGIAVLLIALLGAIMNGLLWGKKQEE